MRRVDLAIVGGGPAGLATAIEAARRGLEALVIERRIEPLDKACGEGIMPAGVAALGRLGVLQRLEGGRCAPLLGIRYLQPGTVAEARFRGGTGLGVQRTALAEALARVARDAGAELWLGCAARLSSRARTAVRVETDRGAVEAQVLVAADGLCSPLRRAAGLELRLCGPRRFGIRRHFRGVASSPFVEVHWAEGVEAYLTPVGPERLGVAFLWDAERLRRGARFDRLLAQFPAVADRLRGAEPEGKVLGAGPLLQGARRRAVDRVVLVGDAAGYVDAITGEGIALALGAAEALGAALPAAIRAGAPASAFADYERFCARAFRRYALATRAALLLSAHPRLRERTVNAFARWPRMFEEALRWITLG